MRKRDLTPADLEAYVAHMTAKFNFSVYRKSESQMMLVAAEFLEIFGFMPKQSFLDDYCTTIANRVYLTFDVGNEQELDLFQQLRVLAHEATHVHQYHRDGFKFAWMYANSGEERADYESEAARTEIPLIWLYYDEEFDSATKAGHLTGYGCTHEQIEMARSLMDRSAHIVYAGGITTEVARETVRWLKSRGVL